MNEYLIIQKRLNYYSCYVKQMMSGLSEEFQTNKIHLKRLTNVLERLFATESSTFLDFFVDKKLSIPTQFIHYLNEQGEIIHVGNNNYMLPPERAIVMPDKQKIIISSLYLAETPIGMGQPTKHLPSILLNYDSYVFLPTLEQMITYYENKLSENHDVEPSEILIFNSKSIVRTSKLNNLKEEEYYILKFERLIGSRNKLEYYFAKRKDSKWYVSQIKKEAFRRTILALKNRKNLNSIFNFSKKNEGFIEIELQFPLPKEEEILLRLIATPEKSKDPKKYLTKDTQLNNIKQFFSYCKMKEGTRDGIYN